MWTTDTLVKWVKKITAVSTNGSTLYYALLQYRDHCSVCVCLCFSAAWSETYGLILLQRMAGDLSTLYLFYPYLLNKLVISKMKSMMAILNQKGRKNHQREGGTFRAVGCQVTVLTANLYCKKVHSLFILLFDKLSSLPSYKTSGNLKKDNVQWLCRRQ